MCHNSHWTPTSLLTEFRSWSPNTYSPFKLDRRYELTNALRQCWHSWVNSPCSELRNTFHSSRNISDKATWVWCKSCFQSLWKAFFMTYCCVCKLTGKNMFQTIIQTSFKPMVVSKTVCCDKQWFETLKYMTVPIPSFPIQREDGCAMGKKEN